MRISRLSIPLLSFIFCLLSFPPGLASLEVKIRLLTDASPDIIFFTAASGRYLITDSLKNKRYLSENESVIIARYGKGIYLKFRSGDGFICDTVYIIPSSGTNIFSLRCAEDVSSRNHYCGELKCFSDMQKLLLINSCDVEKYLEGVVMAEGGGGRNEEYFKTQAVIARTYTCKYFNKHILDGFNLCDDTHCQAYDGIISDSLISRSVKETKGLVITTPDSVLIISAFHSNCGGETSPSEYAWVTGQSYLKRVTDPYCRNSRNAVWETGMSLNDWTNMLKNNGFTGSLDDPTVFNFNQPVRVADYSAGNFSIPLSNIRTRFNLRSTFFSVKVEGDSVILKGRGYGHGVGLCQEGAINMAAQGKSYMDIIDFYYSGVRIINIDYVKNVMDDN